MYAIKAKNLHKAFGQLKVLRGVDLSVERGTMLGLLGPNGAGKTTIVRILSTLLKPDQGIVTIDGYDAVKEPHEVRARIGLTGQYAAVDEYLTGRENLHMMGRLYHLGKKDTLNRTEELLQQLDLVEAADRYARTYSGGMRRRLDLAASLIAMPPILFLDEPTAGLDPRSRLVMWNIIKELVEQGTTILLTTQQLEEADRLADRIAVIDGGKIIAKGTADELKQTAGSERLQFTFERSSDLNKAMTIVGGKNSTVDRKQRSLSIHNDKGVTRLRQLLDEFDKSNLKITSVALTKPTLDDVFLKLTGHEAIHSSPDSKGKREKAVR